MSSSRRVRGKRRWILWTFNCHRCQMLVGQRKGKREKRRFIVCAKPPSFYFRLSFVISRCSFSSHVKWRENVVSRTQWMARYLRMLECVLLSYTHISLKQTPEFIDEFIRCCCATTKSGPERDSRSFISSGNWSNASVCFFRHEIASAFHFFFQCSSPLWRVIDEFFSPALPVHHIYTPGPATLHFKQLFFCSRSSLWCGVVCWAFAIKVIFCMRCHFWRLI